MRNTIKAARLCGRAARKGVWCSLIGLASLLATQVTGNSPANVVGHDAEARAAWANEWLRSNDPVRVAWGAWLARVDRLTSSAPILLHLLSSYNSSDKSGARSKTTDRHDAMLQVLDALIELRVTVPIQDAQKLCTEFVAQCLILVLRAPDSRAALLDIFDTARTNRAWLAAGNVLFNSATAGPIMAGTSDGALVERLMAGFTKHLRISVWDPGRGGGERTDLRGCGPSHGEEKRGWPPVGMYDLTQFPEKLSSLPATLLVPGETPVYYWRVEQGHYPGASDAQLRCDDGNRDEYRAQFLTKLLRFVPLQVDAYPKITVEWRGGAQFQQQITSAVQEQMSELRNINASLQLLFPSLPRPKLEVVIDDERSDKSTALPAVKIDDAAKLRVAFSDPLP